MQSPLQLQEVNPPNLFPFLVSTKIIELLGDMLDTMYEQNGVGLSAVQVGVLKRVVVIDDSIVRGTTSRRLVEILRRAGAKEVHFRVSSPPVKFPCHLGIDTPSKAELISSTHELEEIRREIGADSLAFISLKGMINALSSCGNGDTGFCKGCFSGVYPV